LGTGFDKPHPFIYAARNFRENMRSAVELPRAVATASIRVAKANEVDWRENQVIPMRFDGIWQLSFSLFGGRP
jgi:hypothetical protein